MPNDTKASRLWLCYFFAAIAVVGGVGVGCSAPFLAVGWRWRKVRRIGQRNFRRGVGLLLRVQPWLAADVRIAPEALPDDVHGTLYVSNHRSTLDVFFLLANLSGIRILAKRALVFVPFLGECMWMTRQVFLASLEPSDFHRAMERVGAALRDGEALHVFPEFTRCVPGFKGTQRFALAPFQAARAAGARVVPIVFRDTDRVWPKGIYALRFRQPVRVESLAPLNADDFPSARLLMEAVRSRIDAALAAPV